MDAQQQSGKDILLRWRSKIKESCVRWSNQRNTPGGNYYDLIKLLIDCLTVSCSSSSHSCNWLMIPRDGYWEKPPCHDGKSQQRFNATGDNFSRDQVLCPLLVNTASSCLARSPCYVVSSASPSSSTIWRNATGPTFKGRDLWTIEVAVEFLRLVFFGNK